MQDLSGRLYTASLREAGQCPRGLGRWRDPLPKAYERLAAVILRTGAKLVFLDNLSHLFVGNENDRGDVTRFLNLLNRLAGETGAAIVLLGHTPKAFNQGNTRANGHSGSTVVAMRCVAVCA
jgi:RecA-family ATPase